MASCGPPAGRPPACSLVADDLRSSSLIGYRRLSGPHFFPCPLGRERALFPPARLTFSTGRPVSRRRLANLVLLPRPPRSTAYGFPFPHPSPSESVLGSRSRSYHQCFFCSWVAIRSRGTEKKQGGRAEGREMLSDIHFAPASRRHLCPGDSSAGASFIPFRISPPSLGKGHHGLTAR